MPNNHLGRAKKPSSHRITNIPDVCIVARSMQIKLGIIFGAIYDKEKLLIRQNSIFVFFIDPYQIGVDLQMSLFTYMFKLFK